MSDDGSHIVRRFFCAESIIPIRSSPSESSEMISQLVFGDTVHQITTESSWTRIRHDYDGYEGWVDTKMLTALPHDWEERDFSWSWVHQAHLVHPDGSKHHLPAASRVPLDPETGQIWDAKGRKVHFAKGAILFDFEKYQPSLFEIAETFMHTPYVWGGCSGFGIDCSGFTQRVLRMTGRKIPRDSRPQEKEGIEIEWGQHQSGDLAFFSKPKQEKVTHVGIIKDRDYIIHASGRVRVDALSKFGIIHSEDYILTHQLISIKR
ncbi:MAG: NlpC/P60 family protein [Bacteroidota bacterium]